MMVMIADETPPYLDDDPPMPTLAAANDNDVPQPPPMIADILAIARAIGRQIAREELATLTAANDNSPEGAP